MPSRRPLLSPALPSSIVRKCYYCPDVIKNDRNTSAVSTRSARLHPTRLNLSVEHQPGIATHQFSLSRDKRPCQVQCNKSHIMMRDSIRVARRSRTLAVGREQLKTANKQASTNRDRLVSATVSVNYLLIHQECTIKVLKALHLQC